MKQDAQSLGDNGVQTDKGFQPDWDPAFLQEIHGIGLITGDTRETVSDKLATVKDILSDTVKEIATLSGDVRPGDQAGHEQYVQTCVVSQTVLTAPSFGYKDGISEPAVQDVESIKPGQTTVDQGYVLLRLSSQHLHNKSDKW